MTHRPPLATIIERAAHDLLRIVSHLAEVDRVMRESLPDIRAAAYDAPIVTGGRSVIWCDLHQREVDTCHRTRQPDGSTYTCTGVPILLSDPTGEAALHTRQMADLRDAVRRTHRIMTDTDWLAGMVNRWKDDGITPTRGRDLEHANRPKCELHARYGYDTEAQGKEPTHVRHQNQQILAAPYRLCRWCVDDVRERFKNTGERRLPTDQEIYRHATRTGLRTVTAA